MDFREYYGDPFRRDLAAVLEGLPTHHSEGAEIVLQPRNISTKNKVVRAWSEERRTLFATALFFSVLVDEVCFTHYPGQYAEFRSLTMYPKFIGDCPGGCRTHIPPANILFAMGSPYGAATGWTGSSALPDGALEVMQHETVSFFEDHCRPIDGLEFWAHCERELPQVAEEQR